MVLRAVCLVRWGSLGEPPGGTDYRADENSLGEPPGGTDHGADKNKRTELGPTLAPYVFSVSRALPLIINPLCLLIYEK